MHRTRAQTARFVSFEGTGPPSLPLRQLLLLRVLAFFPSLWESSSPRGSRLFTSGISNYSHVAEVVIVATESPKFFLPTFLFGICSKYYCSFRVVTARFVFRTFRHCNVSLLHVSLLHVSLLHVSWSAVSFLLFRYELCTSVILFAPPARHIEHIELSSKPRVEMGISFLNRFPW